MILVLVSRIPTKKVRVTISFDQPKHAARVTGQRAFNVQSQDIHRVEIKALGQFDTHLEIDLFQLALHLAQ